MMPRVIVSPVAYYPESLLAALPTCDQHPVQENTMGLRATDLLDVVDAAYKVDLSDAEWLRELAHVARPHLDRGFGIAAFEYYKAEGTQPKITQRFDLGMPEDLEAIYSTVFATMDPAIRLRPFRLGPCITGSEI